MFSKSSRATQGFLLALLTAFLWGILPVFLKILLQQMDAYTITAYRFVVAAFILFVLLFFSKSLPKSRQASNKIVIVVMITAILLVMNYVTNVFALIYISPGTVQIVMQIAPFALMLGSVLLYSEQFNRQQALGVLILFAGLVLFFSERIPVIIESADENIIGVFITIFSALAWASYALAQKQLLLSFTVKQLTLLIYGIGFTVLIPLSDFGALFQLNSVQLWSLLFCCANTLIAYGAFTKAIQIWDGSKVSAVISLAPIFTYISNRIAVSIAPDIFIDSNLDIYAYIGAGLVILGAMTASIGRRQKAVATDELL